MGLHCSTLPNSSSNQLLDAIYDTERTDDNIVKLLPVFSTDRALMNKALLDACSYRRSKVALWIIHNTGVDLFTHDEFGYTPLHMAAWKALPDVIAAILRKGMDVNIPTLSLHRRYTPLECYHQFGRGLYLPDITEQLLCAGKKRVNTNVAL